ncbi:nocturnin-like isoform X1 [Xiphophorus maculatus]|nr:nocturnin-like isoform X1 [Xiphophorus maculatus]XP_027874387.1 nocturnin-like isoform X1 [Xiphophorus couchianus]XP_032418771.1 nocturnin-like isoform X1 [Xiphophorus hellerii]
METLVCPMGGGATRLYNTLTQTFSGSSSPLSIPPSYLSPHQPALTNLDSDFCLQQKSAPICPLDPVELLQQCEEALRDRPPHLHRNFVYINNGDDIASIPIRVMQWNILAQALGVGVDNFVRCPLEALSWSRRRSLILEEILAYRPHILCLQEVDHYYDTFQPVLANLGYSSHFYPKPWSPCLDIEGNSGPDGCALFFDESRFELLDSVNIRLSAMMIPTNQVAVVTTLRCRSSGRYVCVAATHLKARSGWEWFRSAQGSDLLWHLQNLVQKLVGGNSNVKVPLLICGDFNAVPSEEVYRRFATSPLGLDSAYKKLSQDGVSEPEYTTWKIRGTGECCCTLDYIWYTKDTLRVDAVLDIPDEEQIGPNRLPSYSYPSDHLSLVCDFSFREKE